LNLKFIWDLRFVIWDFKRNKEMKLLHIILILLLALGVSLAQAQVSVETNSGLTTAVTGGLQITLDGNWTNNGTLTPGSGTVTLNGSGTQMITNAGGSFNNLSINKTGGAAQAAGDFTVDGTFTLTSGDVDLNGNVVTLGTNALLAETPGNTVKGTSGHIETTRNLNAPSSNSVAGMGFEISSAANLGSTVISRGHAQQSGGGNESILRYFDVTPTNNSGLNATLVYHYDDSELDGQTEANLQLYKSEDSGSSWSAEGGTADGGANTVSQSGIASLSRWTAADQTLAEVSTLLASAGADTAICLGSSVQIGGSPTASGGTSPYNYSWSPSAGLDDDSIANPAASPSSTTQYIVTVTDADNNTAMDTVVVTIHPQPVANAGSDQIITSGNSVQIGGSPTASGGTSPYSYSWSPSAGLDDASIANPTASPSSTTEYIVTVTDDNGCSDSDTMTVTIDTGGGTQPHDYVLLAEERIIFKAHNFSDGDIHSNDFIRFQNGNPSTHTGNVTAVGNIEVNSNNTIDGDVTAGGTVTLSSGATVTGVVQQNQSVATVPISPLPNFSSGSQNVAVPNGGSQLLSPGDYKDVTVGESATLQLTSGTYNFQSLTLNKFAVLEIAAASGTVINIVTNLETGQDSQLNLTSGVSEDVSFNVAGTSVRLQNRTVWLGTILAPNATVIIRPDVKFSGAICAKRIEAQSGSEIEGHDSTPPSPDCAITAIAAGSQTGCDPQTNTYTQEVTVTFSNAPSSGKLEVNGQQFNIGVSPQTVTLAGLISNGQPVDVTAKFTADESCSFTVNDLFTAPAPCSASCAITAIAAGSQTGCDAQTNTYTQEVTVTFSNPPSSGKLEVNGQQFDIGVSPQTVTLAGLISNGQPVDVSAKFTAEQSCSFTVNDLFTAPAACGQSTPGVHPFVLLAERSVEIAKALVTEGLVHSNGDVTFKSGNNSTHTGDVSAVGKIKIETKNTIVGDVTAGGAVENKGTVTGTITQNTSVAKIVLPVLNFSAGNEAIIVPENATLVLAPGSYGHVTINQGGRLELSGGEYFMQTLTSNPQSMLAVDVTADTVTINVVGALIFNTGFVMEVLPADSSTARLTLNRLEGGKVKILAGAKVLGNLVAPAAQVQVAEDAMFKGTICAKTINVAKNATVLHHTSAQVLARTVAMAELEAAEITGAAAASIPTEFALSQNYPNPFNPSTTIAFALPHASEVTLSIFNIRGQLVRSLIAGNLAAGHHSVVWDARDEHGTALASGIYVYQLKAKDFVQSRRLVLMK
jgi:cytoskeletal protein CcmA (bactofilin family)